MDYMDVIMQLADDRLKAIRKMPQEEQDTIDSMVKKNDEDEQLNAIISRKADDVLNHLYKGPKS